MVGLQPTCFKVEKKTIRLVQWQLMELKIESKRAKWMEGKHVTVTPQVALESTCWESNPGRFLI